MNKRQFLKTSIFALASLPFAQYFEPLSQKPLNILFLGGRDFLGPTIIETLLGAGHKVTLLNRGITNPQLFPDLTHIKCDREKEGNEGILSIKKRIESENWDCVIDTWQKSPKAVKQFIELFKPSIRHYHYISSIAVYDGFDKTGIREVHRSKPTPSFPESFEQESPYSIRKTLAENSIASSGINATIYRCHGIKSDRCVAPGDPNEEPYWPIRFLQGEDILVPNAKNHFMQCTDAKSLSHFIIRCTENSVFGNFNVAYEPTPFKAYIKSVNQTIDSKRTLHWIPEDFLKEKNVLPYKEIAYWRPNPEGFYRFDVSKALAAGLKNRPLEQLVNDQLRGFKARYPEGKIKFGLQANGSNVKLDPDKEHEVIQAWLEKSR